MMGTRCFTCSEYTFLLYISYSVWILPKFKFHGIFQNWGVRPSTCVLCVWMYVCMCMYVYMYVCMYVYMYIWMYVWVWRCICCRQERRWWHTVYVCMSMCVYVCICVFVCCSFEGVVHSESSYECMHVCMCVFMDVCVYVFVCVLLLWHILTHPALLSSTWFLSARLKEIFITGQIKENPKSSKQATKNLSASISFWLLVSASFSCVSLRA